MQRDKEAVAALMRAKQAAGMSYPLTFHAIHRQLRRETIIPSIINIIASTTPVLIPLLTDPSTI